MVKEIKRYAVVDKDNSIINVILADEDFVQQYNNYIEIPDYVGVGWKIDSGKFVDLNFKVVPEVLSMRQARLALLKYNLLHIVNTTIDALHSDIRDEAIIEWEYATEVNRNSKLVLLLGDMLGLSNDEIDDIFIAGSEL